MIKAQVKWHILSYNAGLNSKYLHFYGKNKMSKNNEIQKKSEHTVAFVQIDENALTTFLHSTDDVTGIMHACCFVYKW